MAGAVFAAPPVKIGALFSVTGPASFLGEPERNTAVMMVDEINKAGGIKGRKLELIVYDTQGDATKARERLAWTPRVTFRELAKLMVDSDLDLAAAEKRFNDKPHK